MNENIELFNKSQWDKLNNKSYADFRTSRLDQFAMAALAGLLSSGLNNDLEVAKRAFSVAIEMEKISKGMKNES